jgi:site-specific recombinase XerC
METAVAITHTEQDLVTLATKKLAHAAPHLETLTPEELETLSRRVMVETLQAELKARVTVERIDWTAEREAFLLQASRTGSPHTMKAYRAGIDRLETWCKEKELSAVRMDPAGADDWIAHLKAEGRAPASVRLDVYGVSSFWNWLERRHTELRNPFRNTRAIPALKSRRELAVPSFAEIDMMMGEAMGPLRLAIVAMSRLGIRVGALHGLTIRGDRYMTHSKGKDISGVCPEEVRREVERTGSLRSPFAGVDEGQIQDAFRYLVGKLYAGGRLAARYSPHDLRHAFAVRLYQETRDIYAVGKALNHEGIATTERYLRSLGMVS